MDHINRDTNLVTFGVRDTMKALDSFQVETLILNENLDY
jgi:peptide subunit release factor 1 (eRF1)